MNLSPKVFIAKADDEGWEEVGYLADYSIDTEYEAEFFSAYADKPFTASHKTLTIQLTDAGSLKFFGSTKVVQHYNPATLTDEIYITPDGGHKQAVSAPPLKKVKFDFEDAEDNDCRDLPGINEIVRHPCDCNMLPSTLYNMIIHLNDYHQWSRGAIADWIETLDIDTTFGA